MSTIIYPSPVFGPVHSRRLGISLGINLLPADGKVCSFDCVYCECGFNEDHRPTLPLPTREEVAAKLEEKLQQMAADGQLPDVLTFAGNGEPTCHPHFAKIIDDTIRLRDQYCPKAKVSVLSNSTMIHRQTVHDALMRVDNNSVGRNGHQHADGSANVTRHEQDNENLQRMRLDAGGINHRLVYEIVDELGCQHDS